MDYIPTQTLEEAESQWGTVEVNLGIRLIFFYDAKEGLLFRSYCRREMEQNLLFCRFIREFNLRDLDMQLDLEYWSAMRFFYADGS